MPKKDFLSQQSTYWDQYTKDIETIDLENIPRAEKIELDFLLSILGNLKNKRVLDLGCGTGKFALKLARTAKEVIGIDISKHSIEIATKTASKYKIKNFKGVVDNFKKPKYKNYFDYVLVVNLIHHTNDLDLILRNIRESLKKGGKLVIFEINPLNLLYIPFLTYHGQMKSHLTLEYLRSNIFSLKRIIGKNGYKIKKLYKWCLLPTSLYNHSLVFKRLNETLNKLPVVKSFCAFHVIVCAK